MEEYWFFVAFATVCSVIGKIKDFPITSIVVHNFTCLKLAREQRRGIQVV